MALHAYTKPDPSPLNGRIMAARKAAGLSRKDAAERLGISPSTLASHENGQTPNVKIEDVRRYAKLYKTTPASLIDGDGPSRPTRLDEPLAKLLTIRFDDLPLVIEIRGRA
jgi:transcriptional regulator with XRE-family HTH domain